MLLCLSTDPVQRKSTMDGDHVIHLLSMLPGERMNFNVIWNDNVKGNWLKV